MPTNIKIIHASEFIKATPEGELDFEESKRLLREIASAASSLTDYEIIVDTRKAQPRMSPVELWYLAAELGKSRASFLGKTAVLCPLESFDQAEFFELCAQNRGFSVRAFTSFEDAIDWLTSSTDEIEEEGSE